MAFALPSAAGLLWIVPWLLFYRETGAAHPVESRAPVAPLLRSRQVWGAMLMRALSGPVLHFYWYWLPEYLRRERQFSMSSIGLLAGIPFLFAGAGNILGGALSSLLIARGWTVDRARKLVFLAAAALCATSMLVPFSSGEAAPVALICMAMFGVSALAATHIGMLTDLFPERALARVTGLTGLAEGLVNMALALATGEVVERTGYLPVFLAAGLMPALAVAALFVLIRRIVPQEPAPAWYPR